jgi:glucosamine--fructose-6-phosphate aminotransferase (isomerizing)
MTPGQHTRREIMSQPEVWAASLDRLAAQASDLRALFRDGSYARLLFVGCGSMYYLPLAAAALARELGLPADALPASELWLGPDAALAGRGRTLLVAVSRSGETTETLRACEAFRAHGGGEILTLSCYPGRPLTTLGALNLVFPAAQETSMAQTRAFSTIYLAALAALALWAGRDDLLDELGRLPDICRRLLEAAHAPIGELGGDPSLDRFYFLGSGPRYGLACELSLKLKEMSVSHSEPFHTLEFRHGPRAMAGPGALIVGLLAESRRRHEAPVLAEMRAQGARTLTLGEGEADIALASGLSEAAQSVLLLPPGQLLALARALHNGCDPDAPANLQAVVVLDA